MVDISAVMDARLERLSGTALLVSLGWLDFALGLLSQVGWACFGPNDRSSGLFTSF